MKVNGGDPAHSNFQVALPNSALGDHLSAHKRFRNTIPLLSRFVSQLLHDRLPLHDFFMRLNRQVLLNPALTELFPRPRI